MVFFKEVDIQKSNYLYCLNGSIHCKKSMDLGY